MGSQTSGQPPNAAGLALVGGTIYPDPDAEPVRDGVVLIEGGKIAAVGTRTAVRVPQSAQILDCSGRTVVAGFWNSHVHFSERKWAGVESITAPELARQLQDMLLRYGFTSVFDLSSPWDNTRRLRDRIESGEVPGPRIRSTGQGLLPPGAMPSDTVLAMMGWMKTAVPEIVDAGQARAIAQGLLAGGVDGIKLFASSQKGTLLSQNAMEAAVAEAHRLGKPVFVHPNTGADVLAATRAGVDVIGHTTPNSGPWDETILTTMKRHGVAVTPTLTLWKHYLRHDRVSAQEQVVNTAIGQLRAWAGGGGTVLFGNDLSAVEYDPTEEFVLMGAAGMSFRQILASMTTAPAGRFGDSKRLGRITAGLEADIVVINHDPSLDLRALAGVRYTIRAGKVIYRAAD